MSATSIKSYALEEEEEEREDSKSDINTYDSPEIPFDCSDMSSSSLSSTSNHQTGGRGRGGQKRRTRSTRGRRTDLPLIYTLTGLIVNFDSATPPTNASHNVGVVYSCTTRPTHGSEAERKMVEAIGKH